MYEIQFVSKQKIWRCCEVKGLYPAQVRQVLYFVGIASSLQTLKTKMKLVPIMVTGAGNLNCMP
jgi:hypothetical protein